MWAINALPVIILCNKCYIKQLQELHFHKAKYKLESRALKYGPSFYYLLKIID